MKKRSLILLICAAILLAALTLASFADFGDFGGDYDYGGGGGYDYGGGNNYGGYDDDDDDYKPSYNRRDDDDDDYDYDSGSSGEVGWIPTVITVGALVALIVWGVWPSKKYKTKNKGKNKNNNGSNNNKNNNNTNSKSNRLPKSSTKNQRSRLDYVDVGDRSTPQSELRPISEYMTVDPDFDAADLREKASNLYVRMQNGWTNKDISDLRPYFTDALFTQFERQLTQKKAQGLTNYIDRISVQNVALRGFKQASGVDHMIIRLEARIIDYTVNDVTGEVVSGSRDREKFMTYEWDMSRTTGAQTLKKDGVGRVFCPSCGAPLDINASARCEYCGSVIESSDHDWAICSIKGLSQKTL